MAGKNLGEREFDLERIESYVVRRIQEEIKARKIKPARLARTIGKSQPWISLKLSQQRRISLEDINLIANGLGLNLSDLLPTNLVDQISKIPFPEYIAILVSHYVHEIIEKNFPEKHEKKNK